MRPTPTLRPGPGGGWTCKGEATPNRLERSMRAWKPAVRRRLLVALALLACALTAAVALAATDKAWRLPATELDTSIDVTPPAVTVDDEGNATAAWRSFDGEVPHVV